MSKITPPLKGTDSVDGLFLNYDEDQKLGRSAVAYGIEGNKKCAEGKLQDAIRLFTKAIGFKGEDHRLYCNRAWCHANLKDFTSALEDADKAIMLNPFRSKPLFLRGRALVGLKKYQQAEQVFKTAKSLDPLSGDYDEELIKVRYLSLREIGFDEKLSKETAEIYTTVQESIEGILQSASGKSGGSKQRSAGACNLKYRQQRFKITS